MSELTCAMRVRPKGNTKHQANALTPCSNNKGKEVISFLAKRIWGLLLSVWPVVKIYAGIRTKSKNSSNDEVEYSGSYIDTLVGNVSHRVAPAYEKWY